MTPGARGGFTLIEAAVALAILGTVSVWLLADFGAQLRAMDRGGEALVASALARDRMDAVRLAPPEDRLPLVDSLREGRFPPPLEDFTWRASTRSAVVDGDLVEVRVEVEGRGARQALAMLLAEPPLSRNGR